MPTYISLTEYTDQGIASVKESPSRLDRFKELVESHGGELKDFFLTMGRYDIVVVTEFPDDESAAKVLLTTGSDGNVSTETLRAFPEDEYRSIVDGLP
ncbi:GYD domain-containing protein [Halobacteriaceae archaeon GCM10025711]